jgi:adenylate kinase
MKNVIFVAPPAAGKGTCSEYLKSKFNYNHVSTGDLLREARIKGDELSNRIAAIMDSGGLVGDDIVLELLQNKLNELGTSSKFILDGYPRNILQAQTLDKLFNDLNISDYVVIYLQINFEEALNRTLSRLICPNCKKGYNKNSTEFKPKVEGICDDCGTSLITRSDDNEETFKIRFDNYMKETESVLDYYKDKNKLVTIDSTQDFDSIANNIERVI